MLCSNGLFAQWETVYFPDTANYLPWLNAVKFYNFNKGFTVGEDHNNMGCILRTSDNGTSWDTVYTATAAWAFSDVAFSDSATVIAIGTNGAIARTNDFGNTWTTNTTATSLISVCFPSPNIGYIAGHSGTILKTINSGNIWNDLATGISSNLNSIFFVNDSIGFACSADTVFKTTNGGIGWSKQFINIGTDYYIDRIFFPSDSVGYCKTRGCGGNGMSVFRTIDQGNTWTLQSTFGSLCTSGMFFTSENIGYYVGQFKVSKTTDGGVTWNNQTANPPGWSDFFDDVQDVFFLNKDTGFVVGNGQFYRISSAGITDHVKDLKQLNSNKISIAPNPATTTLTIEVPEKSEINILNMEGQIIKTIYNAGLNSTIDISNLSNGIYIVKVKTGKAILTDKFILSK